MTGLALMMQAGGLILDAFGIRSAFGAFISGLFFLILVFYGLSRFSKG